MRNFPSVAFAVAAGLIAVGAIGVWANLRDPAFAQATPQARPIKVAVRRLTESQYRHAIADVFGAGVKINARFEPEKREDGLFAIGDGQLSITTGGLEQYYALAASIADQTLDEAHRDATLGCKPVDPSKTDAACARQFIAATGERLFRRPLTEAEITARVATAAKGAAPPGDFIAGIKLALTSLLVAPEFMFRVEIAEPTQGGAYRLDSYTRAARVSFLLWDAPPDAELMAAAKDGALQTDDGLKKQVARLVASPRLEQGARAFFTDMLQFDGFDSLNKDPATYPKFSQAVADSAREETLKSIVDLLVVKRRDYRDIFTSNETYINRPLAAVYNVPFNSSGEWVAHTFPQSSERSGILTQVTFLSLFSHPGRSSPTKRGVKLHEIFMCQPTPDPPANVDFSKVQAIENGTVRTRLIDHMTNAGCSTCHRNSDPPGLTLEHFDGLGQLRTSENGKPIDVSADISGAKFIGAQGLGQVMRNDPKVPACLVRDVYAYGVGHSPGVRDEDFLAGQSSAFAKAGYQLPSLFTAIATSPEFMAAALPSGAIASNQPKPAAKTP